MADLQAIHGDAAGDDGGADLDPALVVLIDLRMPLLAASIGRVGGVEAMYWPSSCRESNAWPKHRHPLGDVVAPARAPYRNSPAPLLMAGPSVSRRSARRRCRRRLLQGARRGPADGLGIDRDNIFVERRRRSDIGATTP